MNMIKSRNEVITYTVNKAINSGLYISVQNGEVVVKAPWYLSREQIQNAVEERKQWILNKIKEYEKNMIQKRKDKQDHTVMLLGEKYHMTVCYKRIKLSMLDKEGKEIKVTLPTKYKKIQTEEMIQMVIDKMYDTIAKQEIERAMEKTRILVGFAPEDYTIKKMSNEVLAKYGPGKKITVNADIVKYPRKVIDYIVLHEYCHLQYKTHAKGFNKMLETYMPDYETIEKELVGFEY